MKKTLVLGASTNEERYSNKAFRRLRLHGYEAVPVGIRAGEIDGVSILLGQPIIEDIDTVTLYVGPEVQKSYYDYIVSLKPKRIIFNPGTENPELYALAKQHNIGIDIACTLVLLATNSY